MTSRIESQFWDVSSRVAAASFSFFGNGIDNDTHYSDSDYNGADDVARHLSGGGGDDDHSGGGVHIAYEDLYASIIFFTAIYVGGQIAARLLKMPSLVGEIFVGIFLGPNLANYVPNPVAFVMLGEIGLILLVIEAGIDIDLTTLKLIGPRGLIIAIVGSILPIAFAMAIAFAIGTDVPGSIAAGACFGPTSLGIAMNILRAGKIVNTPVGQLIVSAAVIDDMIALIILSQLTALSGEATVAQIVIPIVSALGFLVIGGIIAVTVLPKYLDRYFFPRFAEENRGAAGLTVMFVLLLVMMPATYYAKASFLMGAFVSGLVFCRNHAVHVRFVSQFKRILQWLMRVFFAASIGFQVPIKDFGDAKVIGYGLLFTLALIGKLLVGFLVPNFNNTEKFKGLHLRDCLITGCSMAAEGEFAFVIAVFSVDQGLITPDLYASIVLAVLISTIIPPFALRFTIGYFNKLAEKLVKEAEEVEVLRGAGMEALDTDMSPEHKEQRLREQIKANKIVYMCIQIQSASTWGLIPRMIGTLSTLKLEVIDNRSWHPRGVDSTLMTEIFVEDDHFLFINVGDGDDLESHPVDKKAIDGRIGEVGEAMKKAIRQPNAKVKVTRWFPGVLQEVVEETTHRENSTTSTSEVRYNKGGKSVREMLAKEATQVLESKRNVIMNATKDKTASDIRAELGLIEATPEPSKPVGDGVAPAPKTTTRRRVRQKMRSTPVVGGSLFDTPDTVSGVEHTKEEKESRVMKAGGLGEFSVEGGGQMAELVVKGEVFNIRVSPMTLNRIRSGYSGGLLDDSSVSVSQMDVPMEHRLQGFIRTGLPSVTEDTFTENESVSHSEKEA